jgi:formylglycine-generating enzyme required for sulfatase activity
MIRIFGTAIYGDNSDLISAPQQRQFVGSFFIDPHEVTNGQYAVFVKMLGVEPPAYWNGPEPPAELLEHPVHSISQFEAAAYAAWVGKRLPLEFEWEYAVGARQPRAPDKVQAFTGKPNIGTGETQPVTGGGDVAANGLLHALGNVAEWTASPFRIYDNGLIRHPDAGQGFAVIRGGSALDFSVHRQPNDIEKVISGRAWADPRARIPGVGFRCVKDISR